MQGKDLGVQGVESLWCVGREGGRLMVLVEVTAKEGKQSEHIEKDEEPFIIKKEVLCDLLSEMICGL